MQNSFFIREISTIRTIIINQTKNIERENAIRSQLTTRKLKVGNLKRATSEAHNK